MNIIYFYPKSELWEFALSQYFYLIYKQENAYLLHNEIMHLSFLDKEIQWQPNIFIKPNTREFWITINKLKTITTKNNIF